MSLEKSYVDQIVAQIREGSLGGKPMLDEYNSRWCVSENCHYIVRKYDEKCTVIYTDQFAVILTESNHGQITILGSSSYDTIEISPEPPHNMMFYLSDNFDGNILVNVQEVETVKLLSGRFIELAKLPKYISNKAKWFGLTRRTMIFRRVNVLYAMSSYATCAYSDTRKVMIRDDGIGITRIVGEYDVCIIEKYAHIHTGQRYLSTICGENVKLLADCSDDELLAAVEAQLEQL